MNVLYIVAGLVAVALGRLPVRGPAQAGVVRMTTNDFLQVGLYLVVLLLLVKPVGSYMALVFADDAEPRYALRWRGGARASIACAASAADDDMGWKRYALAMLLFNVLGVVAVYRAAACAAVVAAESAALRCGVARFGDEHRDQLRHQHQLAGLRRRVDDELPDPDAGPGGAELPFRGDRHRGAGGGGARLRAVRSAASGWAISGST